MTYDEGQRIVIPTVTVVLIMFVVTMSVCTFVLCRTIEANRAPAYTTDILIPGTME